MKQGIIFKISNQPAEVYPCIELPGDNGCKLLEMLQLPLLPSYTFAQDQLPQLPSAIAELIQYDGELHEMAEDTRSYKMTSSMTAAYFIRHLRELSRMARYAQEHNLSLS